MSDYINPRPDKLGFKAQSEFDGKRVPMMVAPEVAKRLNALLMTPYFMGTGIGYSAFIDRAIDVFEREIVLSSRFVEDERTRPGCTAKIHHGPGHQSSTRCHVKGEHEVHEAYYGGHNEYAVWKDGSYLRSLAAAGITEIPSWVNEGTAMSGYFDEAPEEEG